MHLHTSFCTKVQDIKAAFKPSHTGWRANGDISLTLLEKWSVVNIHTSKEFIQDCSPAKLINPLVLSLISPCTWKRPLHFLNRSTFHTLEKWKAGFLTVYICYLKILKFWFNYNNFWGFAIIEVQLALFKISSTSNTRDILHDWCCHGGSSTSKLIFISENPKIFSIF